MGEAWLIRWDRMRGCSITPMDLLDLHANLLPIDLTLEKACHRALVRLCTLPDTHPLADIIRTYYDDSLALKTAHPTNLHNLLCLYKLNPQDIKKIEPVSTILERLNVFATDIAKTRDNPIIKEFLNDTDTSIYTDGSKIDSGGVGRSAVMYKKGYILSTSKLRYHLGHKSHHSSNEAEAIGLLLGAHLLHCERNTLWGKVIIYSDNQGVIHMAAKHRAKSSQFIFKEFLTIMEKTSKLSKQNRQSTDSIVLIQISWISAHSDVQGNEMAGSEAKLAAIGKTSTTDALPRLLCQPLPKIHQH